MILKVHATRWTDESTRRRILVYARRKASERCEASGRPSRVVIKITDAFPLRTKAIITAVPW